jgi:hypothetical protein
MNPVFTTARQVEEFCTSQGWSFCFIGGLAVLRWGEPRLTVDVDLTILTGFGNEASIVDVLLQQFPGRGPNVRTFALTSRVLLLKDETKVPIDVALGALPFEERAIQRSSEWTLESGQSLRTCSAEDLIVHKVFAGREHDWLDVEGVINRNGKALDIGLIREELLPLLELKDEQPSADRLEKLLQHI